MKKILVIDNYDSFVHNAVQLLRESSEPVNITIQLNDRIDFEKFGDYDGILLSPGPGIPEEAGDLMAAIGQIVRQRIPVLGICLGHQAICEAFGGRVSYAKELMHGKKKTIYTVGESKLFEGLGDSFQAARYHSLAAVRDKLPEVLRVTAEAEDGEIMAVEHTEYPIYGVQFHPESVMTPDGKVMIQNFINVVKK